MRWKGSGRLKGQLTLQCGSFGWIALLSPEHLVDKSGEEGVSAFAISGEPSPVKTENSGFFYVADGLGISHHPARHYAQACWQRRGMWRFRRFRLQAGPQ